MFPQHSAGIAETEIPVTVRAQQLIEAPLLPIGPGTTPDDIYEWRCRAMELINGDSGVRTCSTGRHTRASAPVTRRARLVLVSEHKESDAMMLELLHSVSARWNEPGADKYDLPHQFDLDLVKILAYLTANAGQE